MKTNKAGWRTGELLIAVIFGGVLSYFIAKWYDTQNNDYFPPILALIVIVLILGFLYNKVRPDE